MGFSDASLLSKVSNYFCFFASVTYLVGFASPYWNFKIGLGSTGAGLPPTTVDINSGLFQSCRDGTCDSNVHDSNSDSFKAAQAFGILGFLSSVVYLTLSCLFVCASTRSSSIRAAAISFAYITAAFVILCVITFTHNNNKGPFSWALAFSIIGGLMFFHSGTLLVIDMAVSSTSAVGPV